MTKPRGRDLGLPFAGAPGTHNAITDVPGVGVGFATIVADTPRQVRTGVTAIVPRLGVREPQPVWAGWHALNGNGEMTGTHWIEDGGYFVGPICITNTHSVGIVHHAAVRWTIETYGQAWHDQHLWAMPVVAETYDGVLSDINGLHVTEAHALAALNDAKPGPVAEGNVGGGTGMIAFEFKGGTGSASRRVDLGGRSYHVGALVQANYGRRDWLSVLGVPVGRHLRDDLLIGDKEQGSIIVVIGTDLPLLPHQLRGVAKRASIGIGRLGTPGGQSSGDIFLAFSVANAMPLPGMADDLNHFEAVNSDRLDPIYLAAVEAIEESVINAMLAADDTATLKPAGKVCRAIRHDALVDLMRRHGRMT
ncbi:MAG: P1 family peptidase [Alphaproteobacteria bacterium]